MNSPFGVLEFLHWNHSWNNFKYPSREELERVIDLMKEAGVGWVRMDFLWQDIEPEQGKFDFGKYDQIVSLLNSKRINILGLLHYSAPWASSCGEWNCPPQNNELFVKYTSEVVSRYKDKVKYWEIWNEPDSAIYWKNQDGLKSYTLLLRDVYLALKKIDPECKILNGGLANGIAGVNHLYDNGAKDYFDILNLHIFESPFNPGADKRIASYPKLAYKIMSRNGDSHKKVWITEIGCPGVKRWSKVKPWWLGRNPNLSEQAKWLKEVYSQLLRLPYTEKVFWAFFRDCKEHWKNGIDYFGLITWDYSRKPSFTAFKECVEDWRSKGELK